MTHRISNDSLQLFTIKMSKRTLRQGDSGIFRVIANSKRVDTRVARKHEATRHRQP